MSTVTTPSFTCNMAATVTGGTTTQSIKANVSDESSQTFTVGSSSGQVNKTYNAIVNVNSSGATTLDLTTLTNALGEAVSFSQIVAVKITNRSTVVGENITVGGGTNPVLPSFSVPLIAGSAGNTTLMLVTPITVDSTHKILTLTAAAGSAVSVSVTIHGH